jgi:predicted ATPase/class 3 adenylate cyclase
MSALPGGTLTFLFTDIEGSTQLAEEHPETLQTLLARHHAILQGAVRANGGDLFRIAGDATCAAFPTALSALKASVQAQRALQEQESAGGPVRVRMGITTGAAQPGAVGNFSGEYSGYSTQALAQRVMSAAYGRQILISQLTAELLRGDLPNEVGLRDMGLHRFKGFSCPQRVWQVLAPGLPHEFPPLQTLTGTPNNLPVQVTSFVGREQEIAEIEKLVMTARLFTLCGPGGTGKTRLSLEIAKKLLDSHRDGVWFVELAFLSDPLLVPNAVAGVLGLREEQSRSLMRTILDYIQGKQVMIILDNCEHLIDACARLADTVVRSCEKPRLLCTSREALGISGELVWQVTSLQVPDAGIPLEELAQYSAIRLFLERAKSFSPAFRLSEGNSSAVAQICRRLDGIPLAIELAAARVRQIGIDQIASRLDDRFRLLSVGSRTALPRQKTLLALIEWSYTLLAENEALLFRRLSVFVGGFTVEAAERTCCDEQLPEEQIEETLSRLVDKNMVTTAEYGNVVRYGMLDTIRAFARERYAGDPDLSSQEVRHARFFTQLVEDIEPKLTTADRAIWLERLDLEHDNIRAALKCLVRGHSPEGLRLGASLWRFWLARGHWTEGRRLLSQVLESCSPGEPAVSARAMLGAGALAFNQRDHAMALDLLTKSQTLNAKLGDRKNLAWDLYYLGWMANDRGDSRDALKLLKESHALFSAVGDRQGIAYSLGLQGLVSFFQGDAAAAGPQVEGSLAASREINDPWGIAWSLYLRALVFALEENVPDVDRDIEESIKLWRVLGDRRNLGYALQIRSLVRMRGGDSGAAQAAEKESIVIFSELGDGFGILMALGGLATIALNGKREEDAFCLLGAITSFQEKAKMVFPAMLQSMISEVEEARPIFGERAEQAYRKGRAMELQQAAAFALAS